MTTPSSSMTLVPCKISAILILTLLSVRSSHAWIPNKPLTTTKASKHVATTKVRIPYVVCHMSGPPSPEEDYEEECAGEEECEIDWDKMPGSDDDETLNDKQTTVESSFSNGPILYNDFEDDLLLRDDFSASLFTSFTPATVQRAAAAANSQNKKKEPKVEPVSIAAASQQAREIGNFKRGLVNLEMNWQMTAAAAECNVDIPTTCGSTQCQTCQGSGKRACRFCQGTHFMKFNGLDNLTACRICQPDGTEVCSSCKGSGWIADWTNMAPHTGGIPQENVDEDDDDDRLLP